MKFLPVMFSCILSDLLVKGGSFNEVPHLCGKIYPLNLTPDTNHELTKLTIYDKEKHRLFVFLPMPDL